uniref:PAS domain-containing protein n=1 Tax=uncultured Erythrobacter sp. TaxID=263913 RepID=UPI002636772C|nr:PAS domain-containing protein [uncultured Erythrobacter sp.]
MNDPIIIDPTIAAVLSLAFIILFLVVLGWLSEARAALHRTRSTLGMAGKIGGVGHWRLDIASGELWWSPQTYRLHGRDPSQGPPTLSDAINYYVPSDRDAVETAVNRAMEIGSSFQFMADITREDGQLCTVVSRGICEASPTGGLGLVYGVIIEQLVLSPDDFKSAEHKSGSSQAK